MGGDSRVQRDIDRRIEGAEADTQQLRRGIESLRRLNAMMTEPNQESVSDGDDDDDEFEDSLRKQYRLDPNAVR